MVYNEQTEDCIYRTDQVDAGMSLEEAIQTAFCLERGVTQKYIRRFFAGMYAELMNYGGHK